MTCINISPCAKPQTIARCTISYLYTAWLRSCHGQAQWIRPWSLMQEVLGLNPIATVVLWDYSPIPHCLIPWRLLKVIMIGPLVIC